MKKILVGMMAAVCAMTIHANEPPAGYTALEYVETAGDQYISTGCYPGPTMSFEAEVMMTGRFVYSDYGAPFGAGEGMDTFSANFANNDPNRFLAWFGRTLNGGGKIKDAFGASYSNGRRVSMSFNAATRTFTYGRVKRANCSIPAKKYASSQFGIGARFSDTAKPRTFQCFHMRIYSWKIYTGETLERDYVPCLRDSDGVAGLYDRVNGTFSPSAGSPFLFGRIGETTEMNTNDGKPVKRLNGMCNGAKAGHVRLFKELELPGTRFHDQALENNGLPLIDISRMFPLFHADENDPRNYIFAPTDDYLAIARECGGELEIRLGEQIEHTKNKYSVHPPADIEKWTRICVNIIRHYNDGWANGFHWNLRRFSVWEEPDNPNLLCGAPGNYTTTYLSMYASITKAIKELWPEAEVGGPNCMGNMSTFDTFVNCCAKEKLPLDFAAFTTYQRRPEGIMDQVRHARATLDRAGYLKTKLSVSEWHLGPSNWSDPKVSQRELPGVDSAAFSAAVLILGQDEPVDYMYYYAAYCWYWGMLDILNGCPRPVYYVYRDFAKLAHGTRLEYPLKPMDNVYTLAVKFADGTAAMQVAGYSYANDEIKIMVPEGYKPVSVTRIPDSGEPVADNDWSIDGDTIIFRNSKGSTVRYVTFERLSN